MGYSKIYSSEKKEYMLYITIKCKDNMRKKFRVWAEEYGKKNSKYADREILVDGERTIHFNFPAAPHQLFIGVADSASPTDSSFEVTLIEAPLKTYNVWIDGQTSRFVTFMQHFIACSGYENADERGRPFKSSDGEFMIRYFNQIRDPKTGAPMNTPASVGHNSGQIFVAKDKMDKYTVAMRAMILLHEYSHKYKNPKIGLPIEHETGADINGLYIYLGLGYSKVDAITVFAKVFLRAQTKGNIERMRKINDYIQKFENQEFAELN